jgi:hypothetical protein
MLYTTGVPFLDVWATGTTALSKSSPSSRAFPGLCGRLLTGWLAPCNANVPEFFLLAVLPLK